MKNISTSLLCYGLIGAAILGRNTHASGPETRTVKPALAPIVPKAVFIDDTLVGKDPFFPSSTRRQEKVVRATPTSPSTPPISYLSYLSLKGISLLEGRKLALINGTTIAEGELAEIRLSGQLLKIRCREIRERSAVVEIEGGGEIKELKLRDNA